MSKLPPNAGEGGPWYRKLGLTSEDRFLGLNKPRTWFFLVAIAGGQYCYLRYRKETEDSEGDLLKAERLRKREDARAARAAREQQSGQGQKVAEKEGD